jgi:fatty-acyl-CoA synthase
MPAYRDAICFEYRPDHLSLRQLVNQFVVLAARHPSEYAVYWRAPVAHDDQIYIHKLLRELQRAEQATVLRYRDESVSGEAFRALIFQHARVLRGLGIGRGTLVGMFAPNRPDAIAIRHAAHVVGAATIYLSMPPTESQRRALVEQMAPDLLVLFPETIRCLGQNVGVPFATVGIDQAGSRGRLDALAASASIDPLDVTANSNDLAVVSSSGGSTSVPKGSCRSFAAYSAMIGAPSARDRIQLINGPLAYLSQVLVDITLLGAGCVVLQEAFEASDTLAAIESEKITDLFLVEPQLFELMDHPDVATRDLSSLRSLTHIGASAPKSLRLRARTRLGPIIGHVYGASEMGVVSVLAPSDHDPSRSDLFTSAGRIPAGVEVRFRRADGLLAKSGEAGVIEVNSPAMATGYRNNPQLTSLSFREGWYNTGDLGLLNGDGYLHILGRAVDAQEVNGALITSTGIEEALCCHPSIRYAVAIRDAEANITIAAVVVWPGFSVDDLEFYRIVAASFGDAVAASLRAIRIDRVPLTEQGKPDRTAIKQLASRSPLAA